jgi:hypothetical protein
LGAEETYGFVPLPSWIAQVKETHNISLARNRSKRKGDKPSEKTVAL